MTESIEQESWVYGLEREQTQRRTLRVLAASSVFGRGSITVGFTVAALLVEEILGSGTFAGLSTVAITIGSALSASLLANYMDISGRRPALALGYAVAVVGGIVTIVGGQSALSGGNLLLFAVFLGGMVLMGVGQGATNLARYAAADLALPEHRSRAISLVVFASTAGAVAGPALVGPAGTYGERLGLHKLIGPFMLSTGFFALAGFIMWLLLRPDPLVVAGGLRGQDVGRPSFADGMGYVAAYPMAVLAATALVVSQMVMVMVMAMTPLHMDHHGHSLGWVGGVISAHTAGMFAFAPAAGWLSDRVGRVKTIIASGATLAVATIITALATEASLWMMFVGLFLLGLGWSFGIVAGSALITESVAPSERVAAQGAADVLTNLVSGGAALASGLVFTMAGYHILSLIGIAASAALLGAAGFRHYHPARPGAGGEP